MECEPIRYLVRHRRYHSDPVSEEIFDTPGEAYQYASYKGNAGPDASSVVIPLYGKINLTELYNLLVDERCRSVTLIGEEFWAIPRDIYDTLRKKVEP